MHKSDIPGSKIKKYSEKQATKSTDLLYKLKQGTHIKSDGWMNEWLGKYAPKTIATLIGSKKICPDAIITKKHNNYLHALNHKK